MARKDSFSKSSNRSKSRDRDPSFINEKMDFEITTEPLEQLDTPTTPSDDVEVKEESTPIEEKVIEIKEEVQVKEEPIVSDESDDPFQNLPKKKVTEPVHEETKKYVSPIVALKKENETIAKTFKLPKSLVEDFDAIFVGEDGRKISGTKGLMSAITTNALIEYLVKLKLFDEEYLKQLKDLDI